MSWNERTLALPVTPPSVKVARRWVSEILAEAGRPELIESAQLGVSELVTNALLHADPPVTIRIRGTVDHPRVEVSDQSLVPPQRTRPEDIGDYLPTFGRGLDLVASHAEKWGSEINNDGDGKTVWFEPAVELRRTDTVPADLFSLEEALDALDALDALGDQPSSSDGDVVTVQLLGMPPALFAELRRHFYETGREVRLLALADPGHWPAAEELSDLFVRVERHRRQAAGVDHLDKAIANGVDTIDLSYSVPATAPETMRRVSELLEVIYEEAPGRAMLDARPSPLLWQLQRWYLDQFSRAGLGAAPVRWDGPSRPPETAGG